MSSACVQGVAIVQVGTEVKATLQAVQDTDDIPRSVEIGTDVTTTILNPLGFPFVGYGVTSLGVPFCGCTVLHEFSFLVGGPQHSLSLPNNPTLFGVQVLMQGLDFLAPGGCPDPMLTLTDGYTFTIQ